jgi:hypothetical protein
VSVDPKDSFRQRVFWAPLGVWLTLDSGRFERVSFDARSGVLDVRLSAADAYTNRALLRVEQTATPGAMGPVLPIGGLQMERGAYVVPLGKTSVSVRLEAVKSASAKETK